MTRCKVDGCYSKVHARDMCNCHYIRWRTHGDPTVRLPATTRSMPRDQNGAWKGDQVSYVGAHARVRRYRGHARNRLCELCGNLAHEWAYDRTDPSQLVESVGGKIFVYSPNPGRYLAACRRCHWRLDRGYLTVTRASEQVTVTGTGVVRDG